MPPLSAQRRAALTGRVRNGVTIVIDGIDVEAERRRRVSHGPRADTEDFLCAALDVLDSKLPQGEAREEHGSEQRRHAEEALASVEKPLRDVENARCDAGPEI